MRLLKIGRDATCDIVLRSDRVSSLHAELTLLNNGDIMLEDIGSRNGTFIMNQQIKPHKPVNVRRGDAIRFADVELQWSQVPMPEDNSAYQGLYGIGSHFNNDFQISGSTVSRYHATVKHGRDGKMYLFDHSKNGTTVDGTKIPSNSPYRIKKSSAVVCGGVPVDLSRLPWPSETWRYVLGIAASIVLVVGIGLGVWKLLHNVRHKYTDQELYERYNHSVVMLKGIYHYEVEIGDLDIEEFNQLIRKASSYTDQTLYLIHKMFLPVGNSENPDFVPVTGFTKKELSRLIDDISDNKGLYSGTGFFISQDGKVVTNLHVVKPWLDGNQDKFLEDILRKRFAKDVEVLNSLATSTSFSAYIPQVKVKGILDAISLVPQGEIFDPSNMRDCRVYSAGDDLNKDVAIIRMVNGSIPSSCTFVNVADSMDLSDDALQVGNKVVSIGFPYGHEAQQDNSSEGIQVFFHPGQISKHFSEYGFNFTSASAGGASGSPIFDEYGMLIGVLNSGIGQSFTYGIRTKYVKELIDNQQVK